MGNRLKMGGTVRKETKMPKFWKLIFLGAIAIIPVGSSSAVDLDLARFATAKEKQVREYAETLTNKVPAIVWSYFDAVRVDDWETATNLAKRIDAASGRYTNSVNDESMSPAMRTVLWPPICEMMGTYEQFHGWDNKLLHRFGREIIDSIPKGSIYFGGTDPGRFIISALSESQREGKPFFTLTQNQLVDPNYLEYLRRIYGARLYIPTVEDNKRAFDEYLADVTVRLQSGKLKPGENLTTVDGQVHVSGQVAVMTINGLLAKVILDKNPDRKFFVEESFVLDWMYPYLSPHGPILELHAKPVAGLDEETIRKDQEYWKQLTGELVGDWITRKTSVKELCDFADKVYLREDRDGFKGDAGFIKNDEAQKCFSKLRDSIGGLYQWRSEHARDDDERKRMQESAELAFKQAYALCPYSSEAVFRYANSLTSLGRVDEAVLVAKTGLRLAPDDASFQQLVRELAQKQKQ
ncbi:MAG: Regulatory protein BlaR1 [Pedosphaera sp.]|nr:Regulatory protein BlaR1 [Pedosphaera sp.]